MTGLSPAVRRAVFGISSREATFARRGFIRGETTIVAHLERVGEMFLNGYNAAVAHGAPDGLMGCLRSVPLSHQGFAVEGASMAFVLLDHLASWRRDRFLRFLQTGAAEHPYMAHVGAGWALARLRLLQFAATRRRALAGLDPLLGWLAVDGYGFHEGYFHPARTVTRRWCPLPSSSYASRAFDQGLGRSLWFSQCADPARVRAAIIEFPEPRRSDLWSGVGLACAYAGGVSDASIAALGRFGAAYATHIAQGVAFAVKTRVRAGNLADHTVRACRILCGIDAEEAAAITDRCLSGLASDRGIPAFEMWRQRIAAHFSHTARLPEPVV